MDDSLCPFAYLYLSTAISTCILVSRRIADMKSTKYETKILNGIIPVYKVVRPDAFQEIYDKALKADDTDVIQKVLPRLDYLKKVNKSGYTENQYKIITGETKDVIYDRFVRTLLLRTCSDAYSPELSNIASDTQKSRRFTVSEKVRSFSQRVWPLLIFLSFLLSVISIDSTLLYL